MRRAVAHEQVGAGRAGRVVPDKVSAHLLDEGSAFLEVGLERLLPNLEVLPEGREAFEPGAMLCVGCAVVREGAEGGDGLPKCGLPSFQRRLEDLDPSPPQRGRLLRRLPFGKGSCLRLGPDQKLSQGLRT